MSDPNRKPARPRDAASVVLLRGQAEHPEVLMGRRRRRASFLPNIHVFPGGSVDAADRMAAPSGVALDPEAERLLLRHTPSASPLALAIAGLRETHEETGYLISRPADRSEPGNMPDTPFWNTLKEAGAVPDVARMDYIMRALTPTMSPRRFDTRFFLVDAGDAEGEPVTGGELEDLRWLPLDDAFRLPIIDVTALALEKARQRWTDRRNGRRQTTVPFLHYVRDSQRIDHV